MSRLSPRQRSDILAAAFRRIDVARDLAPMPSWAVGSWRDDAEDDGVAPATPIMVEVAPGLRINRNIDWARNIWLMPENWD